MKISELIEAPVVQPVGGVTTTQTPPAGQIPTTTQNAAEIQRNKLMQRKQVQDQITALNKQLTDLRAQLASIR